MTSFLNDCVFPSMGDMFTFAIMAIFLAAPLAFFLAWKDKKGKQQRESLEALDGWAEVIALVGLDDDEDVLTWRQRCHNLVDVVFDKAEATAAAVVAATKAVKAKVSEAKAEAEAKFRAKAEKAGFVHVDDVRAMIADAIEAHEAKSHRFRINAAFQRKLRPSDEELAKILDAFGVEDFSMHAQAVVRKSIEDFELANKAGRADARQYLRDSGIAIAGNANRYEISKKFELLK